MSLVKVQTSSNGCFCFLCGFGILLSLCSDYSFGGLSFTFLAMSQITTCLWSPDGRALDMAEYYCSVFPDSQITTKGLYDEANPHIPGSK